MIARAGIALFAFASAAVALEVAVLPLRTQAQPTSIYVDVEPTTDDLDEEIEKRYTDELLQEMESARADALLLYTEFTARTSRSLKQLIRNISKLEQYTRVRLEPGLLDNAPEECRTSFQKRLKKIQLDAHRAATFSGENHHKFLLGHMIVFRMHIDKGDEYIKRCDKIISKCGIKCETRPKVKRWRKLAAEEINRLRDDLQHSRKMYRDILTHAQKRLNNIHRQADGYAKDATKDLRMCTELTSDKTDGMRLHYT